MTAATGPAAAQAAVASSRANSTTVVLARSGSPYRLLGQEIAARESIPIVETLEEALAFRPEFLLWVVSPAELSDKAATSFNLALDRSPLRPSTGLITGSTLAHARRLYDSASGVRGDRVAAVLGEDTFTTARLVDIVGDVRRSRGLSQPADVLDLLTRVDYVHYAGH